MDQQPNDLFWNLLAKKLAGEATPTELDQLTTLSRQHPDLMYAAQHIEDLWQLQPAFDNVAVEDAYQKHLTSLHATSPLPDLSEAETVSPVALPPARSTKNRLVFVAILSALIVGASSFFFLNHFNATRATTAVMPVQEVISRPGTRTKLLLSDSTVVWLNAGSKLSYDQNFGQNTRSVTLSGEAFFEVKRTGIPFIVNTGIVNIKVLGTAFNVRSYPGDKTTETSLIHGKVEIRVNQRPDEIYILKPNEKLVVKNEIRPLDRQVKDTRPLIVLSSLTRTKDSLVTETSWIENKLLFEDESFEDIAERMERWYGVDINFSDEKVKRQRYTGVFEHETITQALEALQYTGNFHFTINDKTITIKNRSPIINQPTN